MTEQLTIGDTHLAYRSIGSGPSILFVHGSVAGMDTFARQAARFADQYRTVNFSRRFHPPNAPPGENSVYAIRQQADDLLTMIDRLDLAPTALIGSSFGAYVGLLAALHAKETFRCLILCEPPMVSLLDHHLEGKPLRDHFENDILRTSRMAFVEGRDEEALANFVDGVRGEDGWFYRLPPATRLDLLRYVPELRSEFLTDPSRYMVEVSLDQLHSLSLPVLLMHGSSTTRMFQVILDVLARHLPEAQLAVVPRAGHISHAQNPTAWEHHVRRFLQCIG